ncbi:adenylate/guanylate cyclase domain-containing protein [Labrenzia sp. R4_2]|uniref:adenylate/guanylate cyclase domain-containing protein n=1 Tax=Labrenzia sp. R4_2 TaxID=2821107 RepID=UPI001ADAD369|nr:adenylate/guanylate cyclase domain-containing protein [Labrenzia sp. R4_2]
MGNTADEAGKLTWDPREIRDWLLEQGRFEKDLHSLLQSLGGQLLESGAPVWRLRLVMRTLHPLTTAVGSAWEREPGGSRRVESAHGLEQRPAYIGSPMQIVSQTRTPYRRRLSNELGDQDHNVLHELKARGATDYLALPLRFSDDRGAIFVVTTDCSGGLSDADVVAFTRIGAALAPIVEVYRFRDTSAAIAEAYLGRRTGQMVLDGRIRRGDIERIHAAIMVSDIRDWTGLNMRLSAEDALGRANRYFEIIAEAVEGKGGEILKFIGDGVLAIFPTEDGQTDDRAVCANALEAAQTALQCAQEAEPPLDLTFGIGLHFGEVLYGNIGSSRRIDFTVLGSAVNLASRLEGLCRQWDRPVLFSEDVAGRLNVEVEKLGSAELKGVTEKVGVFGVLNTYDNSNFKH